MALAELLTALEAEAEHAVAEELAAARAEAERISAEIEHESADRLEARLAVRRAELAAETERAVAAEAREARRLVLGSRARLLARVREAVAARLPEAVARPACRDLLRRETLGALPALAGREATLAATPPALLATLRREPKLAGMASEAGEEPGVVLRARDGSLSIDLTLARRLDRRWPALAREIIEALETTACA